MEITNLGVLLLHGWTGTTTMMKPLLAPITDLGLPTSLPALSGHKPSKPDVLLNVIWRDWVDDAEQAMEKLLEDVKKVIIVGHSMGGMLALHLAANHPEAVDSIVTAGTPGRMSSIFAPGNLLHPLFRVIWRLVKTYNKGRLHYADPSLAIRDDSPLQVPMVAVKELFEFIRQQKNILPKVKVPALILHSSRDTAAKPISANMLFNQIATPVEDKRIVWFDKTEHGMFLDVEQEKVMDTVMGFISERIAYHQKHRG